MDRKIYVACLASYNAGNLYGAWIDASSDCDEMKEEVQKMLDNSPVEFAEEYEIHDYENIPSKLSTLDSVAEYMEVVEEYEHLGDGAIEAGWNLSCNISYFRNLLDNYAGYGDSEKDWCEDYLEESGFFEGVANHFKVYFDTESYINDLKCGGDIVTERVDGKVYVFWNC